jgi:hypothetical protein
MWWKVKSKNQTKKTPPVNIRMNSYRLQRRGPGVLYRFNDSTSYWIVGGACLDGTSAKSSKILREARLVLNKR